MSEKAPDDSTHESEKQDANEASTSTTPVRNNNVTVRASRSSIRHLRKCKFFEKLRKLRKTDSGEIDPKEYETLYLSKEHGCTSDDDYAQNSLLSRKDINQRDKLFRSALQNSEFTIKEMLGDGSCFFRSIADQIYGDQAYHGTVRAQCMDYIDENKQYFAPFITENFDFYVGRKRMGRAYANHLEVQAVAELYKKPVEIYFYNGDDPLATPIGVHRFTNDRPDQLPVEICFESKLRAKPLIQLSYHNKNHYNSLVKLARSVASQTAKLGKEECKSLPPANVESATSSTGVRTPRIQLRKTKEKKKEANLPAKKCVRMEHRPIGIELQDSESTHRWMAAEVETHRRFLKDALQGRAPFFYSSPFYRVSRAISKATFVSIPESFSVTSLNIALPSIPAIPGTSAETSQIIPQKSSSNVKFHTPLETTPTRSDGKPLQSILKKTLYNRIFHPELKKTSNFNRTSFRRSSSSSVAIENPRCFRHGSGSSIVANDPPCISQNSTSRKAAEPAGCFKRGPAGSGAEDDLDLFKHRSTTSLVPEASSCDKNKIVKKHSQHILAKELKSMKTLKKRGKEARKDMRKMEPASPSTSSESMPRLPCRKPKKKQITKSSSTEPRRIKKDSSSSGAAADVGSSSDESD